jgi:GNAT superfamily N-acetyltransferase
MALVVHHDPQAFLVAARPIVADDPARRASVEAFLQRPASAPDEVVTRMAIWTGPGRPAVLYQRGDGPVVIGACTAEAARAAADWMGDAYPALASVVGSEAACEAFAGRWGAPNGGTWRVRTRMRNHMLRALVEPRAASGSARVAAGQDLPWIIEHQQAFAREAGIPDSSASMARIARERLAGGGFRIWRDGTDVAYAGFSEAGPEAARVAPVFTLPAHRGRGYASSLVATIVREQLARGRLVFLVTDIANPTSNALYARLGFQPLDDFVSVDLPGRS